MEDFKNTDLRIEFFEAFKIIFLGPAVDTRIMDHVIKGIDYY